MRKFLQGLVGRLRICGIGEVYSSFDALPVEKKSHSRFTVIGIDGASTGEAYPVENGIAYPFTMQLRAELLTPMTVAAEDAVYFFFEKLLPVLVEEGFLPLKFDAGMPKTDLRLGKLVYGGTFRLQGAFCVTKEDAA